MSSKLVVIYSSLAFIRLAPDNQWRSDKIICFKLLDRIGEAWEPVQNSRVRGLGVGSEGEEPREFSGSGPGTPSQGTPPMTKAAPKLALTPPQTIPLDKLTMHDGNVRQIKAGVSIESLAADIERRGLLQSLSVRPILNGDGEETGQYGVQAGGRRLRALQLLVKQKKLAKNAPVPCIVRSEGFVEADSLAENTEREALHPLDQFRAFKALADKGEGEETIAAAFNVSAAVVKQRLRLSKASPRLLKAYEEDEISLEQLMAFCLTDDLARQEQVFDAIQKQWNKGRISSAAC